MIRVPIRTPSSRGATRRPADVLVARLVAVAALAALASGSAHAQTARTYDPAHPWYAEAAVGTIQPGPSGRSIGGGQTYLGHVGYQTNAWSDVGVVLAWSNARDHDTAIETDVTSGGVRARGWVGAGRFSPYAEVGARLYSFSVQNSDLTNGSESDHSLRFGGDVGAGVLYSRSTYWFGIGAELHGAVGEAGQAG